MSHEHFKPELHPFSDDERREQQQAIDKALEHLFQVALNIRELKTSNASLLGDFANVLNSMLVHAEEEVKEQVIPKDEEIFKEYYEALANIRRFIDQHG